MIKSTVANLFTPVKIGSMTLRNRIAMAPMGTGLWTQDGLITEQVKAYYEARARGGTGMVIVEHAAVDFYQGMNASNRPSIDSDLTLPGLAELASLIKKYGAKAAIQINHGGRMGKSRLSGLQPVAASPIPIPGKETPKQLGIDEIRQIVQLFAQAVARAKKAGFDGAEIHAAHSYLIAHFLSPFFNRREDEYGGSLDNRVKILIEVIMEARALVGKDYPLWCRINALEAGVEGGLTLEESKAIVKKMDGLVDAVNVSIYGYGRESLASYTETPGSLLHFAADIRQVVSVPVIAVGRLTPEVAEAAIREGKADITAIGRGLLADPEFPARILAGNLEEIRPCIVCFHCNDAGSERNSPISCSVNGATGREVELEIKPARDHRRIAVIGGGPAGMEAARVLALRGHRVVLFEKEGYLGGQMNLAMVPPHKKGRLGPVLIWYIYQLNKLNVEIRSNTEANLDIVRKLGPAVVVLATGAVPVVPALPGIEQNSVFTAFDVLTGRADVGHSVVIVGGGSIGCETSEFLYEMGKQVTVVEMLPELAMDMGTRDRRRMLNRLISLPITFVTSARCVKIMARGVVVTDHNGERTIPADAVILAVGTRPNNTLYPVLRAAGIDTRLAGDCWHGGKIAQAISDGLRVGLIL